MAMELEKVEMREWGRDLVMELETDLAMEKD